ncbi:MAG: hypothetical protein ACMUEL_04400 [Flavobacteriales bacterium Tduv]
MIYKYFNNLFPMQRSRSFLKRWFGSGKTSYKVLARDMSNIL